MLTKLEDALQCASVEADEADRLRAVVKEAISYLEELETNMVRNDVDMLIDQCDPPSKMREHMENVLNGRRGQKR